MNIWYACSMNQMINVVVFMYLMCSKLKTILFLISFEHDLMVTGERKIDIALWIIFIQSHNVQHLILLWDRNILFQYCTYSITISISRYRHLFLIICAAFIFSYTCGSNRLWNQLDLHCFMITSRDKNYNQSNLTINIPW